jgi:uncharacterized protein YuzE
MEKTEMSNTLNEILSIVPHIIKLSENRILIDYDREADVLYVSFKKPQEATDSEMLDNGILIRYKGDELVGITILDAARFFNVLTEQVFGGN